MAIASGTRLGTYEILTPIGSGGMGDVYKARDTKLDREVAIKVLPDALAGDTARLARFEREAKVLASLNHPHIAHIYGIEESSEIHALVMELVPGEPIHGPLPVATAVRYARQIAEALEAAHEKGVVHRDLKPANILVTPAGIVKVLDFGLATVVEDNPSTGGDSDDSPTVPMALTQDGMVMGTAAYMSPEQARGRPVDRRSDVWSFGVVLFEMLTGHQLFGGETVADTIAAVLTRAPDYALLPPDTPASVRELIGRCLTRDLNFRLATIREARLQLEQTSLIPVSATSSSGETPAKHGISGARDWKIWVAAGIVVLVGAGYWLKREPTAAPPIASAPQQPDTKSIAVLPFVNESGNADDEYFSDGMTDELASALMKVSGLRVAAHSSTFTFKGKPTDVREVGLKLHVGAVLEGTVRRAGSKLRVTAQLVNAADGLALWSERFEREAKDVFKVQDDITGAIVSALRLRLGANAAASSSRRAESVEAHDLYLRGRFLMLKQTEEGLRKSLDYFSQALVKDPGYAPAYDGISYAWVWLADAFVAPRDAYPKAQAAALKALELDPLDGDAHCMLAAILSFYEWKVEAGEAEFRRAIELNPNSLDAHYLHAIILSATNHLAEAIREAQRAINVDPLGALPNWTLAYVLHKARRYDEAIIQHLRVSELDPNFFYFGSPAAQSYREKGMLPESAAEFQRIQKLTGQPSPGLAITYARMGKADEARKVLKALLDFTARNYVSPEQVATVYVSLGEKDQAFAWLEKAYEARSAMLFNWILVAPEFDTLRSDSRYSALVTKMGLAK